MVGQVWIITSNTAISIPMVQGWRNTRRPTVGMLPTGGIYAHRLRIFAIADLKEFNRKDRARSWINKVKSAFLRDQALGEEKSLVFGDLLTRATQSWYNQLSRSTRYIWKRVLELSMADMVCRWEGSTIMLASDRTKLRWSICIA